MAGLVESLVDILEQQCEVYENLLGLGKEKRDVIIKNEIEELQKITSLENTLVSQNNRFEKNKNIAIDDVISVLNIKEDEFTLMKLAELMEGKPECERLLKVLNKINDTIKELKQINDQNRMLVKDSLDFIEYSLNVYRGAMDSGAESGYSSEGGTILNQRAFFDAKQ